MITRKVLRTKKVDVIKSEKHRDQISVLGAIIEYQNYKWFVELETDEDVERFEKFITENNMESEHVMETKLHQEFTVTDFDEDEYRYFIK